MTVKIKTFGSIEDANEWFREGRTKKVLAVIVVRSTEAGLAMAAGEASMECEPKARNTPSRNEGWKNAVRDYAQAGIHGRSGGLPRKPPHKTTETLLCDMNPVRRGVRDTVPSAMAGALARIAVRRPEQADAVMQFATCIMRAAIDCNDAPLRSRQEWNAKRLVDFAWSLYYETDLTKSAKPKIIYRATAVAFACTMHDMQVSTFSTDGPLTDVIT